MHFKWSIIIHQLFWSSISFALFFFSIRFFAINNIFEIWKKRSGYAQEFQKKTSNLLKKANDLDNEARLILDYEIPAKKKAFLSKSLKSLHEQHEEVFFKEIEIIKSELLMKEGVVLKKKSENLKSFESNVESLAKIFLRKVE